MLNFIGRGSAFNTKEGNNSAFIRNGETLLLIDCGSDTFSSIQRLKLLDGVKEIYVLISHTHPDHIGSLGDLIFYSYYAMNNQSPCLTVISSRLHHVEEILKLQGVSSYMYFENFYNSGKPFNYDISAGEILTLTAFPSSHVEEIDCFSFIIIYDDNYICYSADSNKLPPDLIVNLTLERFTHYQDVCGIDYEGNVHLSYSKLKEAIPPDLRNKVYCMHLDGTFDEEQAIKDGFNVVQRYGTA